MADNQTGGTSSLTASSAASLFEDLFSGAESEETQGSESPQENNADEGTEPLDDDASEEQVDEEGEEPADETDSEEQEDDAEPASQTLRVKLPDGEKELPVDEVVKGYLRTADYTRKTQAHAENVKAFEGEKAAVRGERQQYAERLTQLDDALRNLTPAEPDWETLRQEDPTEYGIQFADWQRHKSKLEKVGEAKRLAVEAVTKDQVAHLRQHLESEQTKLLDAIPSWKNEAVATRERADLKAFALKSGYSEDELNGVYDHRVMLLLRKAMLHDKAEAAKPAVRARIEQVKVATPGPGSVSRPQQTEHAKARQRLAKTGSVRDAAAVFEKFIG